MPMTAIDRVRRLQEYIFEVGLAQSVLALPAPRMLSLAAPSSDENASASVFGVTVKEPEIVSVSRDLYVSGHYSIAVQEAFKSLEKYVQAKAGEFGKSGTDLMDYVFSPGKPKLEWTSRQSVSEQDEQKGYQRLFSGVMLGVRNPVAHEFDWIDDETVALELLVVAQHLIRKAKAAKLA